jgi:quinol monooxygenase YgiN
MDRVIYATPFNQVGVLSDEERIYLVDTKIPEIEDRAALEASVDSDDFDAVMAALSERMEKKKEKEEEEEGT